MDESTDIHLSDMEQPTPSRLEDGLQGPPAVYLAPSSAAETRTPPTASTPDAESSFDLIDTQIESGASQEVTPTPGQEPFDEYMADKKDLQKLADDYPLPLPLHGESYNKLRYAHFAVYQRLFAIVLGTNTVLIATFAALYSANSHAFSSGDAVTAVAVNILLAMLMRQENCINMLFHSLLSLPRSWPVSIRRHAAKIYCYGGMHSASGISAMLWYLFFLVLLQLDSDAIHPSLRKPVRALAFLVICLLLTLCIMSIPRLRSKFHNQWELSHRYLGWALVLLVWAQICCVVASDSRRADSNSMGSILLQTPAFWILLAITFLLIYPWMRLRKVYFTIERLSTHAIQVHVKTEKPIPSCVGIGFSTSPLIENHKFATIPNPNRASAFSVIIANNGDWTHRLINNPTPPPYLWTRGIPALGVARISTLFRRIVLVATGSGIGPLMSFFNSHPDWAMRIVWAARTPYQSYGKQNLQNILRADPKAIIMDSKKTSFKEEGMPDLIRVSYGAYRDFGAEAVVVISNPTVTKEVVYALETRKVPAYGAIFDS